jgi:hypothetical protein
MSSSEAGNQWPISSLSLACQCLPALTSRSIVRRQTEPPHRRTCSWIRVLILLLSPPFLVLDDTLPMPPQARRCPTAIDSHALAPLVQVLLCAFSTFKFVIAHSHSELSSLLYYIILYYIINFNNIKERRVRKRQQKLAKNGNKNWPQKAISLCKLPVHIRK